MKGLTRERMTTTAQPDTAREKALEKETSSDNLQNWKPQKIERIKFAEEGEISSAIGHTAAATERKKDDTGTKELADIWMKPRKENSAKGWGEVSGAT